MPSRLRQGPSRFHSTKDRSLDQISFHIGRAYYNYTALLDRVLAELDLHQHLRAGMGHILFALYEEDDRIIKEIAEQVQLSASSMTWILKQMERAGLIERRRDDQDGRATRIRLTCFGRSLESRCYLVVDRINQVLLADLPPKELETAKKVLLRMITSMRNDESIQRRNKSARRPPQAVARRGTNRRKARSRPRAAQTT